MQYHPILLDVDEDVDVDEDEILITIILTAIILRIPRKEKLYFIVARSGVMVRQKKKMEKIYRVNAPRFKKRLVVNVV